MTTVAAKIRRDLRTAGYSTAQVSVRQRRYGYDMGIDVTIKVQGITRENIENIVRRHEKLDYCPMTLELLLGGNVAVSVDYSWDLRDAAQRQAEELVAKYADKPGEHDLFGMFSLGVSSVQTSSIMRSKFEIWQDARPLYAALDEHELTRCIAELMLDYGLVRQEDAA